MKTCVFLTMAACVVSLFTVSSYPNGKVNVACDSMLPIHQGSTPQSSAAPYKILVSKVTFNPGDEITVTLQANTGVRFLGFLLEARAVGGDFTVGTFTVTNGNSQGLECNKVMNSAVSHTNRAAKSSMTVTWTAPPGSGFVRFRATFVQSFSTFWTQVESQDLLPLTISSDNCDSEKLCFSSPNGCNPANAPGCAFMSSVPTADGGFVFEMSAASNGYVAIGFSSDKKMGNDDMYMCVLNNTQHVEIQNAFSTGQTSPTLRPQYTTGNSSTSFNNGVIRCTFISRNNISLPNGNSGSLYYIFLATGPVSGRTIRKHSQSPLITNEMVDILKTRVQVSASSLPTAVKVHGSLMLIAWMTTGSIGMVVARYLKNAAGKPVFGKALWFQVHFFLMVLTVSATATAFIVIFVEAMGWSDNAGAHPILGCIVMILSFLQPVVALLRPDLNHRSRFIFNWVHALNALVIKVLAVATLFLGFQLIDRFPDLWMGKVLGGFVAWEALTILMLELNIFFKRKDSNTYEFEEKTVKNEVVVVTFYVFGNLAFLIALLAGIGQL